MSTSPESPPVPTSVPVSSDPTAETTSVRPDEGSLTTGDGPEPAAVGPPANGPAANGPAANGPAAYGSPSGPTPGGPVGWQPTAPFAPPPTAGPYPPAPEWYPYPSEPNVRMRRSATDKMLAGVCGGIAEHTDIDPVYIRLAFLISLLWGGIGFFVYVVAAILIPKPLPTTR